MVQKHNYKPTGTTAIICYKKRNQFLSVVMYWYNLTALPQVMWDKKSEYIFTVLLFNHSLWYKDPCQECNQQEVEETAALASSFPFAVSANSLHGSSSSNGFPVVILCVSWKICWRTRMSEVFYCSWSTDSLYAFLLSSMNSNYNKVDISY